MLTSKSDFNFFKKECRRLIKEWGITDWSVYYRHCELDDCYGTINAKAQARVATIFMAKTWSEDGVTESSIRELAKHEVLHLLLAEYRMLAYDRHATDKCYLHG